MSNELQQIYDSEMPDTGLAAALHYVAGLAVAATLDNDPIEINGKTFVRQIKTRADGVVSVDLVEVEVPSPKPLQVRTLDGVLVYINDNPDIFPRNELFVQVYDEQRVSVHGMLKPDGRRNEYVTAVPLRTDKVVGYLGSPLSLNVFITFVQALFADSPDRARLLSIVGNITDERVTTAEDDGVTQRVAGRTGIAKRGEIEVINPFNLAALRSFPEIDPVLSPFVLRILPNENSLPSVSLAEADVGAWRVEAVRRIAAYLADGLAVRDITILA